MVMVRNQTGYCGEHMDVVKELFWHGPNRIMICERIQSRTRARIFC